MKTRTPFQRGLSLEDRFNRHVQKNEDGCWSWTSVTDDMGRGRFKMTGRMVKAHLAAKQIFHGEEREEGLEAHHTCLNGWCVNPTHVEFLTKSEHRAIHRKLKLAAAA